MPQQGQSQGDRASLDSLSHHESSGTANGPSPDSLSVYGPNQSHAVRPAAHLFSSRRFCMTSPPPSPPSRLRREGGTQPPGLPEPAGGRPLPEGPSCSVETADIGRKAEA